MVFKEGHLIMKTRLTLGAFLFFHLILISEVTMACNPDMAKRFFNDLSATTLDLVDQFYDQDIVFRDPVHELRGPEAIKQYYVHLYRNVKMIRFDFTDEIAQGDRCMLAWTMHLEHPAIKGGKRLSVDGTTVLHQSAKSGKIVYHRDFFDMGEFIYENVWGLGTLIRYIKSQMRKY